MTSGGRERRVVVSASVGSWEQNAPDPGPSKFSIKVRVQWSVWFEQDVYTDQIGLNLVLVHRRRWWRFWRIKRTVMRSIPRKGHDSTEYREALRFGMNQPFSDYAEFEYVGDRPKQGDGFELVLVLKTGVPPGEHRILVSR